jgi:hypothetical protein
MCKLPLRALAGLANYVLFEPHGSGLKFYNLHQTLNTSINALNSFTDIYLISSARIGFVFFISFTNFFLIVIVPLYPISPYLSSLLLGACCLGQLLSWLMTQEPWSSMLRIELVCPQLLDPRTLQRAYCFA